MTRNRAPAATAASACGDIQDRASTDEKVSPDEPVGRPPIGVERAGTIEA